MAISMFFLLLLSCWPSSINGLGVVWKTSVNDSSDSDLTHESTAWPQIRQFALSPRDYTTFEHWIPGLAKNSKCCGIVNRVPVSSSGGGGGESRIVNGTATTRDEFPWMAALISNTLGNIPFCGGFLINNRYVLTAAECCSFWPSPQFAYVALRKYEVFETSPHELRREIHKVIVHPRNRQPARSDNDIALLRLASALDLPYADNSIAPICLPTRSLFTNTEAEVAGYGLTRSDGNPLVDRPNQLDSVKMRIVNNGVCSYLNAMLLPNYVVRPSSVCAIGIVGRTGPCTGDNGSPLMVKARYRKTRMVAVGIASWSIGCAEPMRPSVYTRVSSYLDWILANTQDATYC